MRETTREAAPDQRLQVDFCEQVARILPLTQPEQPGSKPTRPRGLQNAVAVTASVLWGTEGLDSGYDQPGFGRKQGRPPVVSRAQYDVESLYLFCTWTSAFERFSRIWRFGFPKVLGNMDFWADRLPPPPPLPLYEECFRCASIVQGSVRLSAGRRAGPHARGRTGTSCAAVRLYCAAVRPPRVHVAAGRAIIVR